MACDTTYQRRSDHDADAGAERLAKNPKGCICDCEVVMAIHRADSLSAARRRDAAPPKTAPDPH